MRDLDQAAHEEAVNQGHTENYDGCVLSESIIQVGDDESSSSLTVDVCVEAMKGMDIQEPPSSHDRTAPIAIHGKYTPDISLKRAHKPLDTLRNVFRRYVSMPRTFRGRIQVIQHQVEASKASLTLSRILEGQSCRAQKLFIVRRVRPRATFSRRPSPRITRTGRSPVDRRVKLMGIPEIPEEDWTESVEEMLHLRGGCGGWMRKKGKMRRLEDDEEVPPMIWWLAGGRPGHPLPTGKRLTEWRAKSKGQWQAGQIRSYLQEFTYVLSDGKFCRDQPEKKEKKEANTEDTKNNAPGAPVAGDSRISAQA
ncbi:hypothetical protein FQN49_007219 [Arthroderma sp. PD_2]|nr:hypothetical protein FQN49_007219 [Arthroderma sp. PD_2]